MRSFSSNKLSTRQPFASVDARVKAGVSDGLEAILRGSPTSPPSSAKSFCTGSLLHSGIPHTFAVTPML